MMRSRSEVWSSPPRSSSNHALGIVAGERLELERRSCPSGPSPPRANVQQLWPRRRRKQHWALHVSKKPLEQVEKLGLRPVQILDEDDEYSLGDELLDERNPGFVQAVARCKRV